MAVLLVAGNWSRQEDRRLCIHDGVKIEPRYRVRVVDRCGNDCEFCSITCAELWLKHTKMEPKSIFVTDETSGDEIDAASAYLVRSLVVTNPISNNSVHAFQSLANAENHARFASGVLLVGDERPFHELGCPECRERNNK
jgi:hypothetical protein